MAMEAAVRSFQDNEELEHLKKQIAECPPREPRFTKRGFEYLCFAGVYDVKEIGDDLIDAYADWLLNWKHLKIDRECIRLHQCPLKKWREFHKIKEFSVLKEEIERCEDLKAPVRNKAYYFLMEENIYSVKEIDYEVRTRYEAYLKKNMKEIGGYLKAFDKIKVFDIKERNNGIHAGRAKLRYHEQKIFLKYHPDYDTAIRFSKTRNPDIVLWDFSIKAGRLLKQQIFMVMNYALEKIKNLEELRKGYLMPLQFFYRYCVEHKIEDISRMEKEEVEQFQQAAREQEGGQRIHQIVEKAEKILFLISKEIDWQANTWYFERFSFDITRYDPARPVTRISFFDIKDKENRKVLKEYMKYLIGITSLTITTIVALFYYIKIFLVYLDNRGISVLKVCALDIDTFLKLIDDGQKTGTYNAKVKAIYAFFRFLVARGYCKKIPFYREYYLKKEPYQHHYRAVPQNTVNQILKVLHLFPEELRLMYLHLWCLGLRIGEVCTIKRKGYFLRDGIAWLKIYQHKLKMEKVIPIPTMLYKAMQVYLENNEIKSDGYAFPNHRKNGPYTVGSFWHEMVELCEKYDIRCGDHVFQAHDYRHSVATMLYEHGASLQAIRDFLGHKHEDMTRQYIDCIGKKLDQCGEAFFEENGSLAGEWKRGHAYGKE